MDTSIFTAFSELLKVSGVHMLQSLVHLQPFSSISLFEISSVVHRDTFKVEFFRLKLLLSFWPLPLSPVLMVVSSFIS